MLASCEKIEKARISRRTACWSSSLICSNPVPPAPLRYSSSACRRISSTKIYASNPCRSRIMSPNRRPSKRMKALSRTTAVGWLCIARKNWNTETACSQYLQKSRRPYYAVFKILKNGRFGQILHGSRGRILTLLLRKYRRWDSGSPSKLPRSGITCVGIDFLHYRIQMVETRPTRIFFMYIGCNCLLLPDQEYCRRLSVPGCATARKIACHAPV